MKYRLTKLMVPALTLSMLAGCGSAAATDSTASSASTEATGAFDSDENVAYKGYLPSEYVELGTYKGVAVNQLEEVTELDDDQKEEAVESFLADYETQEEITDRASQEGDYVEVSYTGTYDGTVVDDSSESDDAMEVLLGSGEYADGFEDALIGTKAGDTVTTTITYDMSDDSEDSSDTEEADTMDVEYSITVNKVYQYTTPELTEDFVKANTDYTSVEEAEEAIYQDYLDSLNSDNESYVSEDAITAIVEDSTFNGYPQDLYDTTLESLNETYQNFFGTTMEEMYADDEEGLEDEVYENLKNTLVVEAIAEKEGMIVTQQELDDYKDSIVNEYGDYDSYEALAEDYDDSYLADILLNEKVTNFIVENADITVVSEDEYYGTEDEEGSIVSESVVSEEE